VAQPPANVETQASTMDQYDRREVVGDSGESSKAEMETLLRVSFAFVASCISASANDFPLETYHSRTKGHRERPFYHASTNYGQITYKIR